MSAAAASRRPERRPGRAPGGGRRRTESEQPAHEAEIRSLQRQYNEILRQREVELATCQAHGADLQKELEEIAGENAELREKIRTVKLELARLQKMIGPPSVRTDNR